MDTLPDWGKYLVIYVGVVVVFVIFHFAFTVLYEVLKKRLAPVLKKKCFTARWSIRTRYPFDSPRLGRIEPI